MTDKFLFYSLVAIILVTLYYTSASMFNSQPQFTIKTVKNKEFDGSCLIDEFNTGNIADCLEHCLQDCRCQSFQICQKTKCQLCSSHKEEHSSLLHDKDGCVYAMYEMRHLTKTSQKLKGQCSDMSCSMKYNCCQQSGLCPENKICKPINSQKQPWKRFTCECPDGYHGDNCKQPIYSCSGYLDHRPWKNGMYKVVDFNGLLYEVYCHFDSDGAWTLVQSFSFVNHIVEEIFQKPLTDNHPVSENALTWSGYRLRKTRMQFINRNSELLRFTCGFEKVHDVKKTDYLQMPLDQQGTITDITMTDNLDPAKTFLHYSSEINETNINPCRIELHQTSSEILHVHTKTEKAIGPCMFSAPRRSGCNKFHYFSYFPDDLCLLQTHRCTQNRNSTSQLWFGKRPWW